MMTFGLAGMSHPSLAALVDCIKAKMSREALHLRFTDKAVAFLSACVRFLLQQGLDDALRLDARILNRFRSIHIVDSSSWAIAAGLKDLFPGCGGSASPAGCKVQVCYEYLRGALSFFDVVAGNRPDGAWSARLPQLVAAGDLLITDLGYFCLRTLQRVAATGAFFLSRFLVGTTVLDAQNGLPIDLCALLRSLTANALELPVVMGANDQTRVSCRLVCLRVSDAVAKQRRDKLVKSVYKKKKRTPSAESLYLCNWILMVTNVPADWLDAGMVRPFYSLRWQIELLFKQLKSILSIHESDTAKEPRLRCQLLGRMIVAILTHRIHAHANTHLWNTSQQEISMEKLHKRLQERAFTIKDRLLSSARAAAKYLTTEIPALLKNCRKLRQPSRPSTLECLHSGNPRHAPLINQGCLT